MISDAIVPLWTYVSEFRSIVPFWIGVFFFHPCIYPFFPLFRLYKNLPEVKAKNEQQKRLAFYRTNRLRAQLYDKVSLFFCYYIVAFILKQLVKMKTGNLLATEAWENTSDQVSLTFDWLRDWREFSGPITE